MRNLINISIPKKIFMLTTLIIIILFSCENPFSSSHRIKPGSRDYVWEADTLAIPFTILHKIWGSSPNDVWAIGPGGDLDKTIFHFDGEKWTNDSISRPISPLCIWGFAKNDVWIGGHEGRIWHFDGTDWSENLHIDDPLFIYSSFTDIWGENHNNIWTVGLLDSAGIRKGLMYHYNGKEWKRINIDYTGGQFLKIRRGLKTNKNYYLTGLWENDLIGDSIKILEYSGGTHLKQLKISGFGNGKWMDVQEVDDEIIFTINNKLYTYNNNKFELLVTNPFPNSFQGIDGRNKKDIFWMMQYGITHYNGNDIKYILKFNTLQYLSNGVLFKNKVFFLANDYQNYLNIIYRGTLKK